jgi:hypothetical protein
MMSLLAQCGFGRGQKIETGFNSNIIQGVIMSPRDETRIRLENDIRTWSENEQFSEKIVLFDPQFYVSNVPIPDLRDGHLPEYEYYNQNSGLGRANFSRRNIIEFTQQCIHYQHNTLANGLSYIIAPSIAIDDFRDCWSQIALDFYVEAIDIYRQLENPQPLLLLVIVSENAFQSLELTEEYLNELTRLNVEGFYIILRCNSGVLQKDVNPTIFSNFMYFCYVLSTINEYCVIVGYSDWQSFLLESVGVTFTACGWFQNLKQFSFSRFAPSTGGQRPRKRYSSLPLFSNLLIHPDMENVFLAGRLGEILSGSHWDQFLTNNQSPAANETQWSDDCSCFAHWFSLSRLSEMLQNYSDVRGKILYSRRLINQADLLYRSLAQSGIEFDLSASDRLASWRESIRLFCSVIGIDADRL